MVKPYSTSLDRASILVSVSLGGSAEETPRDVFTTLTTTHVLLPGKNQPQRMLEPSSSGRDKSQLTFSRGANSTNRGSYWEESSRAGHNRLLKTKTPVMMVWELCLMDGVSGRR